MFNKKKTYSLRKAKNVTTLVGCEVGTTALKTALVATVATVGLLGFGNVASADEVVTTPTVDTVVEAPKTETPVAPTVTEKDKPVVEAPKAENPNPATNLPEAQELPTEEAVRSQTQSETSSGDVTAEIESPALDEAVKKAEEAGVKVETGETKTVTDLSEAEASYEKQAEEVKKTTTDYTETKKAVEDVNAKADSIAKQAKDVNMTVKKVETVEVTDKSQVKADVNDSAQKRVAEFVAQLAKAKANANKNGYMKTVLPQDLVWNNEPKATLKDVSTTSSGKVITSKSSKADIDSLVDRYKTIVNADFGHVYRNLVNDGGAVVTLKKVGDSATVVHNGLKNSYIGSTVIDSVKTVYTLVKYEKDPKAPAGTDVLLGIYSDPTSSVRTTVASGKIEYDVAITYYDKNGKEISLDGRSLILGASSLNHEDTYLYSNLGDSFEYVNVSGTNGKFVPINGSSITVHSDGRAYSGYNNARAGKAGVNQDGKSPFEEDWDRADSPNFWYGAIAVQYTNLKSNTIHVKLGAEDREETWFTLNSKVPSNSVVLTGDISLTKYKAVAPAVTINKYEVSQKPAISKSVQNDSGDDVNGKMVAKGSTDPFILKTDELKAGRDVVEQGSYVLVDNLPTGYMLDLKATQDANKDYTVTYDKATHTLTAVATETLVNAMNADLKAAFDTPDFKVIGSPQNDNAKYVNNYSLSINDYKVYSNTVTIYTPGGEDPNNGGSTIQPRKKVVDDAGSDINNKSVLPSQTMNYLGTHNLDQYKGMKAGLASVLKGFAFVDDYLDDALDGNSLTVNSITAANGDDVSKFMTMYHVLSPDVLSEELRNLVVNSGISPVGAFYLWVANNPEDFYNKYVQQGLDITYNLSFKIKDGFVKGDITNQVSQIDFGNGYYGNIVLNPLTPPEVSKDVLDKKEGSSIDNGEVKLGDNAVYKLTGWVVPAGRGYDLYQYTFKDKLQVTHDEYQHHEVTLSVDVILQDGTVIKAGEDLAQYTTYAYNKETGQFELVFKEDFLRSISRDSQFGADVTITVKRIKAGTVENEYTLTVNGDDVVSNKVVTTTPEPPQPTKETPVQSAGVLPKTGETGSILGSLGIVMLSFLALLSFKKVREED